MSQPRRSSFSECLASSMAVLLCSACGPFSREQVVAPPISRASGTHFKDCEDCPDMVVIPAGRFRIGSPDDERGHVEDEGPQRELLVETPFAISRTEVTLGQYKAFVTATGHAIGGGCITDRRKPFDWQPDDQTNFYDPGYPQEEDHPVVCVSWFDAQAFVGWLNARTGGGYRLPSEAEWEYAARGGSTSAYFWGADVNEGCAWMNGTDQTARDKYPTIEHMACRDGYLNTAPVGAFRPNGFGLHDMTGNAGEWTLDCATPNYNGLTQTLPAGAGDCSKRMVRGGSWGTIPRQQRLAERMRYAPDARDDSIGIRLVKDLRP